LSSNKLHEETLAQIVLPTGPGRQACKAAQAGTRPLTLKEKAQLQSNFKLLDGTEEGKKSLYAVAAKTGKTPTLAGLEGAGVMVRMSKGALNCGAEQKVFACTTFNVDAKGKKTYVIMLDEEMLNGSPGAAAPWLGHELRHVSDRRRFGDNVSKVRIEQAGRLREIYIAEQLKKNLCTDQSRACQAVRLDVRIWEDDLANNPMRAGEFTDDRFIKRFDKALLDEKKGGLRGTPWILEESRQQFQKDDQQKEKMLGPVSKLRTQYNMNNKELDKAINGDADFRRREKLTLPPVKKK
jgi:hypothetical protein